MANYLKGLGDLHTRQNEILPSFDAKIFQYITQNSPGICALDSNKFVLTNIDRGVSIGPGMMQAFGYFGLSDTQTDFTFVYPTGSAQYSIVYAEINLAIVPHQFAVKASPQGSVSNMPLVQDDLGQTPSGIYQLPLYLLTINSNQTITTSDQRISITKPQYAKHAENADLATVAQTANTLAPSGWSGLDTNYMKVNSLKRVGETYGQLDLGNGGVYININATSANAAFIIVQGILTCANSYAVTLFVDINGSSTYAPTLYYIRSVNGQVNTSYGFVSLEIEKLSNQLFLIGFKINQSNNAYGSSHTYATNCKFTPKEILEVLNTKP